MDRAGILASLCFPTITRFCGQLFMEASDREFGLECLKIYNDWLVEEWCGAAPGRYIPLMLIPHVGPARRRGGDGPHGRSRRHHLRLLREPRAARAADDPRQGPLLGPGHVGRERARDGRLACTSGRRRRSRQIAPDSPFMANLTWGAIRTSGAMLSWIFSGMFLRFPNLKIALSEGEVGWMPYFLERAEQVLDKQRYWVMRGQTVHGPRRHRRRPRPARTSGQTFRDHVFGCFIEDHHGIASLDEIGEDNVMCETDYPHSDSTWPDCIDTARRLIKDLPTEVQYKLLRGNAERLYRFTPAEPPVLGVVTTEPIAADRDRCIGSGMCASTPPATFTQDAEAKVVVLDPHGDDLDTVRIAVEACPTRALALIDRQRT